MHLAVLDECETGPDSRRTRDTAFAVRKMAQLINSPDSGVCWRWVYQSSRSASICSRRIPYTNRKARRELLIGIWCLGELSSQHAITNRHLRSRTPLAWREQFRVLGRWWGVRKVGQPLNEVHWSNQFEARLWHHVDKRFPKNFKCEEEKDEEDDLDNTCLGTAVGTFYFVCVCVWERRRDIKRTIKRKSIKGRCEDETNNEIQWDRDRDRDEHTHTSLSW